MFTDSIGRKRHFVTCKRCGNMGPPSRVWSKRLGKYKLVCPWCLEKLRRRLEKRLDTNVPE